MRPLGFAILYPPKTEMPFKVPAGRTSEFWISCYERSKCWIATLMDRPGINTLALKFGLAQLSEPHVFEPHPIAQLRGSDFTPDLRLIGLPRAKPAGRLCDPCGDYGHGPRLVGQGSRQTIIAELQSW